MMAQIFHAFNHLPAEIRANIWQFAVDTQQRVITTLDGIKILKAPTPPLFLVSHEAKECAMRQYRSHTNEYQQYSEVPGCIQTDGDGDVGGNKTTMTAKSRGAKCPYFAPKFDIALLLPGTADGFGDVIWRRLLGTPRVAFQSLQHAHLIFGQISPSNISQISAVRAICVSKITEVWILNDGNSADNNSPARSRKSPVRWSRKLPKYWLHPYCEFDSNSANNGDDGQDANMVFRDLLRMNGFVRDEQRYGPPIL